MGVMEARLLILVNVVRYVAAYGHVPDEQILFEDLMRNHQKSVRPVVNSSTVMSIKFALRLNRIIELNERKQVLTTDMFIDQEWTDENLRWTPDDYSGIMSLRIPADDIWRPDTFIYNNADEATSGFLNSKYVLVHHDGSIFWPVPLKLKSSCKVNILLFPFDEQECSVLFGSCVYNDNWVNYITVHNDTDVEMAYYVRNTEWELLSVTLQKCAAMENGCTEPKASISLRLRIRRNTFYYMANIIVPCIMLSILMLFTFWLPPTSSEKVTMGLSVFLVFFMFMLLVAEEVPATSEAIPLIGIYLCVVMTMTSVSVILGVIVINIYNRGMKMRRAPYWIRKLILEWIARALRLAYDVDLLARSITLDDPFADLVMRKYAHSGGDRRPEPGQNGRHAIQNIGANTKGKRTTNTRTAVHCKSQTADDVIDTEDERTPVAVNRKAKKAPLAVQETLSETESSSHSNYGGNDTDDNDLPGDTTRKPDDDGDVKGASSGGSNVINSGSTYRCRRGGNPTLRLIVAEWQQMAAVMDRFLFWVSLFITFVAYFTILVVIPLQYR